MSFAVRWSTAVCAATVAIGLVGCSGSRPGMVGDDPEIIVHDLDGGGDALFTGTLTYDSESKCLFLAHDNGAMSAPLWPQGTTPVIEGGRRGVDVKGHGRILDGDRVEAGGGGIGQDDVAHLNIPANCVPEVESRVTGLVALAEFD